MKLGIVSDTHDHFDKAEQVVDFFEDEGCEKVVHCGDMICPATAELFDAEFDFYTLKGNNDGEWKLKETVEEFGNWMGNVGELEFSGADFSGEKSCSEQRSQGNDAGVKFAVYHGTDEELADGLVESEKYDYVLRGHTHRKKVRESENSETVEINPGGVQLPWQEEKLHVVVMDLETEEFEFHRIDEI